jgi:hypothetical protein
LIAICSVLFLRGALSLAGSTLEVSFEELCDLLRGYLQRQVQTVALKDEDASRVANLLQNLEDVTQIMPKPEQGLDINV